MEREGFSRASLVPRSADRSAKGFALLGELTIRI